MSQGGVVNESATGGIVRRYFAAYQSKDRSALEALLRSDFVFSSPNDDRIDRKTYFERCWPFSEQVRAFHIEKLFECGNEVFVTYECEPKTGEKFRNTEFFRIEKSGVREVSVYFGPNEISKSDKASNSETEEIRRLVEERTKAVRAKDVAGATSLAASDIVLFDVVNPLQTTGSQASKKRAAEWFSTFEGPIGFEIHDLKITANGDVGFSHCLNHVNATTKDGKLLDMYWRCTVGYRKTDGRWKATHEHNSVPFDMTNGKASLDLKP